MEFEYEVRVPKDRIAVLIGKKGEIKKKIQKALQVRIKIDSKEGDVTIKGEDSLECMQAENVIKAIARGFSPETAASLLNEDYAFEIIDFTELVGKQKNRVERVRARVIGTRGKAREHLEKITQTRITIYGKTVSILGEYEDVRIARRAIEALINGSQHKTVYMWIEKQKKKHLHG